MHIYIFTAYSEQENEKKKDSLAFCRLKADRFIRIREKEKSIQSDRVLILIDKSSIPSPPPSSPPDHSPGY